MKNSLLNMILVLGGISLIASAGVGYVYNVTEEPIALAAEANKKAALSEVLPGFDNTAASELVLDEIPVTVHTAYRGGTVAGGGEVVGYAVETATTMGFSGWFRLMVGFTPDGKVRAVKVLEHAETPGLGSKMADPGNVLFASFEGRNPSEMKLAVTKDGGEVDALTAATITSRAYVDAVARAFNAMMQAADSGAGVDAATITSRAYVDAVARAFNAMMQAADSGAGVDAATGATTQNADTQSTGKEAKNE